MPTTYASRFSPAALENTLKGNYGLGLDADYPPNLRFARGVATVAKRRYVERAEEAAGQPVIFVMHPGTVPAPPSPMSERRVPMLDNGLTAIGGSIWFVNYAVTEGLSLELSQDEDDATLFELVRGAFGLGDVPAAVIETRGGLFELRFFPQGLNHTETCEVTDLSKAEISLGEVFDAIDSIWQKELCTPSAQTPNTSTWAKASSLLPSEHAEQRVQRVLKVGLGERFRGFTIRQEQAQISGRLDLEIEEPHGDDPSTVTRHVLIELKVLRAKSENGTPYTPSQHLTAISEGVDQARAYRDERGVRSAALCCFDMRATPTGNEAFDHVTDLARDWSIELRLWHLFNTDKAWREFTRPAAESSSSGASSA